MASAAGESATAKRLAGGTSFARNGDEYVVAWVWNGNAMLTRIASVSAVPAATAIPATFNLFRNSVNSLDLSPDGSYLAYSYLGGEFTRIGKFV